MDDAITLRDLQTVPARELAALQRAAFADHEPSPLLADVLAHEAAARPEAPALHDSSAFGVAALRGDVLVGWTQGYRKGQHRFYMLNSGVAADERRRGVYSRLVAAVLAHARSQGFATVGSRHTAANAGVIIAKLRLGFQVSGFEYSEVYGPLVQLTYLVGEPRRRLHAIRAAPIRPQAPADAQ